MFSKTSDPASEPSQSIASQGAAQPAARGGNGTASRSVLGTDLKITGEITSTGTLEIMGEIDGNIRANSLIVGPQARVSGTITAQAVEITGRVDGKVESESFTMRAGAQVAADVTYETLVIESGAQIEGRFNKRQR